MASILIIEPDRLLARNYAEALRQAGHEARWAANGQVGINLADEQTPDLILLELQMPSHNGLEFLYELRSYPEWQGIPVILLSMVPDMAVQSEEAILTRLGVVGYLYKPQAKLRHVVRAVERALQAAVA